MFTGIVEDIGTVAAVKRRTKESTITFRVRKIDPRGIVTGESISVSGACLTVTSVERDTFTVDASRETLSRTSLRKLRAGQAVNLERSLRAGDRMGGHIVSGHVDGVGKVKAKKKRGGSVEFTFTAPESVLKYIVEKGSVAVDGVSLTVNSVKSGEFTVNIIPYTLAETTFGSLRTGSPVNIECDIIGKYVEKLMTGKRDEYTVY
ncbi:MAG TPA: riboflavin synthase [Thermodesulfobacteriota bacterium]|nr:riboflavin synthase [Thermodesulfobacteriota bacterium]